MSYDAVLTVGGVVVSAFDISEIVVTEMFMKTRQFEANVLDESRSTWTLEDSVRIEYGFSPRKVFLGSVEGIDKRGALAIITGRDVTSEILDRPVDKDYTDTEAVAIMKDLIDTYAPGEITYANATASAVTVSGVDLHRISMMNAFNKLIYYAESVDGDNFLWYIDHAGDLHTFAEGDVDNGYELEWMVDIFEYRRVRDSWRTFDKVTVYGGLNTDGDATSASAGSGTRERVIIDEFLITNVACSQRAVSELKLAKARTVYALTCILGKDSPTIGERVFVTLDPEGVEMSFIVYSVKDHLYSGVTVIEVGESVEGILDSMIAEHILDEYMKQIKPVEDVSRTEEGTLSWLKASGTAEAVLMDYDKYWTREFVIGIKEMSDTEPAAQVLTFRVYRYINLQWMFDDSVDVVPSEKDVVTISGVFGPTRLTMEPLVETQQNYSLPYTLYYQ